MKKVLMVVGIAAALAGCGSDDGGDSSGEYPKQARDNFVNACVQSGGEDARDACTCVLEKLQKDVPFDEFEKADTALREGKEVEADTQKKIDDATSQCRKES